MVSATIVEVPSCAHWYASNDSVFSPTTPVM
jgi:hypothetical protein